MSELARAARVLTVLVFGACGRASSEDVGAVEASAHPETPARSREPGRNPFGFESLPLDAQARDYALVPSRSSIHEAFERGFDQQTFVYLGARLEQVFEKESRVRWLTEQQSLVPNALILPIPRGARASAGAIVLTSWVAGGGVQRALVVAGGSPESPKVRYLDLPLDGSAASPAETLAPDTFRVLDETSDVGITVACPSSARASELARAVAAPPKTVERWIVVKRSGENALGLGFAGKMRVLDRRGCVPLPLRPRVSPGERVYVPNLGGFVPAHVEEVDAGAGRVRVRFEWAGEIRRPSVGYTNIALELPPAP
jgi:hypothetical protein